MKKSTKIVATIGPATETKEIMMDLINAGMNVARFNTKHGTIQWHQTTIARMVEVAAEMKKPIAILLDLQGPEIRITLPTNEPFEVKIGDNVTFTSDETTKNPKTPIIPQIVVDSLDIGSQISIDDGLGEFEIIEKDTTSFVAVVKGNFKIGQRKTLNTPGKIINLPSLIETDFQQLDGADNDHIDFIGLSFVRNKQDIIDLRSELDKRNLTADIVAKIENQSAIENFDEILEEADAIMVARGDLAVEVPFEELSHWQKVLIHKSREAGKPVITATQMLKSMVENPRPTRAEVSDVANAIYDGTDAVMLSEETTIGAYPIKAVETQAKIAAFNETFAEAKPIRTSDFDSTAYIAHSAVSLLEISSIEDNDIMIDKIICLTETGRTAKLISRFRQNVPIHAITSNEQTFKKLNLVFNVTPHIIKLSGNSLLENSEKLVEELKNNNIVKSGENVLLVHGKYWIKQGLTNTLSIIQIP
ncbi:MAG: pyruvate kinase [Candidatus Pacebacteria bacterium CG_4_10_14_3_um_filter_34_15]|nr:pyruvate kinase [Candidatus Pacearchaeota archaeon]NCQ65875.1 pyruvate kinase [Candidatus Paceibacterota bacterium]OIO44803.1 MAG: pyruvate kinase [Candidatus Pacebacteria bacterium CG1_02_43_31]PIQ81432.1 MAG: pyruvate kinase [Candidatus Pacebacteria bacterium CG11_big_fil_rev_8_21_14_0_20_34_55]PIX81144.1 MAG: pyruvate kinase [Candidatus Pacebacteria bacterium CG_4_10_14_3_um_filter_34_15]PJC43542.1 MAG: pyruvate kinase [Candidatus Pacebacteria bacterium CG_4_9_14_0_2_um_filter_34_50]